MVDSYAVGIDLGTTNAVIAYSAIEKGQQHSPQVLPIGQWVDQGIWQERPVFPTYRYHVLPHEQDLLASLPFEYSHLDQDFPVVFGEYAVKLGALNRGQGVSSAKSWLSQASRVHHDAADAFLPWGTNRDAAQSVSLVSPVIATASYLYYLHQWWNHRFPENPLQDQCLVITLPASFDEYARDLTLAAAELAGLGHAQFLEEPTAAAYAWLEDQQQQKEAVSKAGVMCVLDVGGGTTDLSLIDFSNPESVKRLAVGDHLMLGGDNIDAAIAQTALVQMQEDDDNKIQVSTAQWAQLMLSARECKEVLMSDQSPEIVSLSLLGRGKSLIARQKKASLSSQTLRKQLLEGFLPSLKYDQLEEPMSSKAGLVEVGLQFEQDTAMTRHLLRFLKQDEKPIDSVLLNGGFFKSRGFQDRIAEQFQAWADEQWQGKPVHIIQSSDPQLAVALGAAAYAQRRVLNKKSVSSDKTPTQSTLIGGGSPRYLYLQLDGSGEDTQTQVVCVAKKGMEEGVSTIVEHRFQLVLNQPVLFTLYSTTDSTGDDLGDIVAVQRDWSRLPAMQVTVSAAEATTQNSAPVQLVTEISAVGALQLQLKNTEQNLPDTILEFAGRSGVVGARVHKQHLPKAWPHLVFAIEAVYGPKNKRDQGLQSEKEAMSGLRKTVDQVLGTKSQWDVTVCRSLSDALLRWQKNRRRTVRHEAYWLSLLGFAMRPGYGVVGDSSRMEHVKKVLRSPPAHHDYNVWFAWWTLVRRVAPALGSVQEVLFAAHEAKLKSVFQTLTLKPKAKEKNQGSKKGAKKNTPILSKKEQDLKVRAPEAMLRAISSLDRIRGKTWFENSLFELVGAAGVGVATPLGVNLQSVAWCFGQVVARYSSSFGRAGTGSPASGCTHETVFHPLDKVYVEQQVQTWLTQNWRECPELGLAASIAAQTASEEIEISDALRYQVEMKLHEHGLPESWRQSIRAAHQSDAFQDALAGENLPQGIGL